jgi:voltage-gated potassium channel
VVAPDTDEAAVLVTLTARQMVSRRMTIVAAAREEENAQLLRQSGADSVITSAEAAGRLLGLATETPRLVKVLEDLLATGVGLDIAERPIEDSEAGPRANLNPDHLVVAVVRDTEVLQFDDPRTRDLLPGDRILYLYNSDEPEEDSIPEV